MEPEQLATRLSELEALAAFQERTIAQLDEVVREFSERIEGLEREVATLRGRLDTKEPPRGDGEG